MTVSTDPKVREAFEDAGALLGEAGFKPLFMAVKGSEVYELPGTHTDIDVRVIYQARTKDMLRLTKPQHTFERMQGRLDLVGWEAERFFHHLLKHNGNMVETLLTPEPFVQYGAEGAHLRAMGERFITKKLYWYYRGYAAGQFKRAQQQIKTGKGVLYTLREMYAGIWVLLTGEVVYPWAMLRSAIEDTGIHRSQVLDDITMDRTRVDERILRRLEDEFTVLNRKLDSAFERSRLPADFDGRQWADDLLVGWRTDDLIRGIRGN